MEAERVEAERVEAERVKAEVERTEAEAHRLEAEKARRMPSEQQEDGVGFRTRPDASLSEPQTPQRQGEGARSWREGNQTDLETDEESRVVAEGKLAAVDELQKFAPTTPRERCQALLESCDYDLNEAACELLLVAQREGRPEGTPQAADEPEPEDEQARTASRTAES